MNSEHKELWLDYATIQECDQLAELNKINIVQQYAYGLVNF